MNLAHHQLPIIVQTMKIVLVIPLTDFDPENIPDDSNAMMENFCEKWVHSLDQDTQTSLGLFLFTFILVLQHSVIKAAEYAGMLVQRSDRTVRLWRKSFF